MPTLEANGLFVPFDNHVWRRQGACLIMNKAKNASAASGSQGAKSARSRRKGWIVIALVAIGTLLFFVAGTIDPSVRYDLIGL